jgi:GxxExxY protein
MGSYEKDELTEKIIGICFRVHRELGPGFTERVYHHAMIISLKKEGVNFETKREFTVKFEGLKVGAFRCDLLIEQRVILEFKAVTGIMPLLFRQKLIAYLTASRIKTGLLVNFGNKSCDVKRVSV